MSLAAKAVFTVSCAASIGIILYVHIKQEYDNQQVHLGVVRDLDRQERRRRENIYILEQQATLASELRKEERERNS